MSEFSSTIFFAEIVYCEDGQTAAGTPPLIDINYSPSLKTALSDSAKRPSSLDIFNSKKLKHKLLFLQ